MLVLSRCSTCIVNCKLAEDAFYLDCMNVEELIHQHELLSDEEYDTEW